MEKWKQLKKKNWFAQTKMNFFLFSKDLRINIIYFPWLVDGTPIKSSSSISIESTEFQGIS